MTATTNETHFPATYFERWGRELTAEISELPRATLQSTLVLEDEDGNAEMIAEFIHYDRNADGEKMGWFYLANDGTIVHIYND